MGADIYLRSVNDRCKAAWKSAFEAAVKERDRHPRGSAEAGAAQEKVSEAYSGMYAEGYFRDSYNSYGLFAQTELSWWRDVVPMLDDEGRLPLDRAAEFREMVASAKLDTSRAEQVAAAQKDDAPEGGWVAYYERDRAALLALVDLSIKLGEPLEMSL